MATARDGSTESLAAVRNRSGERGGPAASPLRGAAAASNSNDFSASEFIGWKGRTVPHRKPDEEVAEVIPGDWNRHGWRDLERLTQELVALLHVGDEPIAVLELRFEAHLRDPRLDSTRAVLDVVQAGAEGKLPDGPSSLESAGPDSKIGIQSLLGCPSAVTS